jgi:hypothetical protein
MSVFAYILDNEMLCPRCGKSKPNAKECHRRDYSYGYEVIGCNWCNETLETPF